MRRGLGAASAVPCPDQSARPGDYKAQSLADPPPQTGSGDAPQERGPWRARHDEGEPRKVFVESYDFTHDVRLYVNGDFVDDVQRLRYAEEIARRLNRQTGAARQCRRHKLNVEWRRYDALPRDIKLGVSKRHDGLVR